MNQPQSQIRILSGSTTELGSGPLEVSDYYTPQWYALEKERVFKRCWLRVGLEYEIPRIGDYFVKELTVCDTSIVVVRGEDLRIRAFHNMCSHRNNRVAYAASGNVRAFTCRFHSWSYGLDGCLVNVPEEQHFLGLCKEDNGLAEVGCETWEGFIFVNLGPPPRSSLRDYLGEDIWNGYEGFFPSYKPIATFGTEVRANWKIVLDAFVETYHFSTVHPATAGDVIVSPANPNGRIDAVRLYPRHRIISATANVKHRPTLAEQLARQFGGNATLAPDLNRKGVGLPPQINPLNIEDWVTDILVIFPMCNIQPFGGFFGTQDFWPLSHDRTYWELTLHMLPPENAASEVAAEYNRASVRDIVREDLLNIEMIQSNLASGAKTTQNLGDMEIAVRHAYKAVRAQVEGT